jgi:hypothetical protein
MIFLVAAAVAAGVLYLWLKGHWFGRVLAFLVLAVAFGLACGEVAATFGMTVGNPKGYAIVGMLAGGMLAWLVSGLPDYYYRRQIRLMVTEGSSADTSPGQDAAYWPPSAASSSQPRLPLHP